MYRRESSSEEEEHPLLHGNVKTQQEIKPWDVFDEDPSIQVESASMEESKWIDFIVILLKLLAYLVTFAIVLGGAVISKATLLFMTSQIEPNQKKPYCNKDLLKSKQFVVELPQAERVAWIWVIVFAFFIPELGTFIRSVRICCFKSWKLPRNDVVCSIFITESLPTVGSAILVFCVLPNLDVVKGVMLTNTVCFVPAVIGVLSRNPRELKSNPIKFALDLTSIAAQATAFVIPPLIEGNHSLWLVPVSTFLISCGYWENFVSEESPIPFIRRLGRSKKQFDNNRYFVYAFVSLWKCCLFGICTVGIFMAKGEGVAFLFESFGDAFREHFINVTEIEPVVSFEMEDVVLTANGTLVLANNWAPLWTLLANAGGTYLCYVFGKFACKILIQGFSYAFPVNLSVPTALSLLVAACALYNTNNCAFYEHLPGYLFFNYPSYYSLESLAGNYYAWAWLFWMLSQAWIAIHIWRPECERLARTEKIFVRPMYDAFLIDQSMALNRRRDDRAEKLEEEDGYDSDGETESEGKPSTAPKREGETTRIYACGTMWHETKEEMMEFLKSILRLDEDQCARQLVRDHLDFDIPDYYELETHILFDDAFVRKHPEDNDPKINNHVRCLISTVNEAAFAVHQRRIRIRPPKKYLTPYGGQLVWTLPGRTKMYAHLKDKKKIRPKKRWSQVMYMYYLLGHRLMECSTASPKRKQLISENTYILALDGDIDFQPNAVHLLVDLMKKNKSVGAACGRIHPIGSGPMVWYQMFEYAIGHWLQKATEHMIGCVLCSPGCFSLFRAKALMDRSVMKKYTTPAEEARDFVQFDQGEDRWLCTLMLQVGYRVEYSAASDAFTHCPEGFNEFYNQRRRWMPSTTANILDLLMSYKRTVKINDNISRIYVIYQIVLMIGTILGPGTIFLMLVGAFVAAFQMDQWTSFIWNVIPILLFISICFLFDSKVQLLFAGAISAMYGLVMMAVLVGVMLQITNDGFLAPSSLFFFCVAGEIIITGLLHPKELNCLPYGIVYYVTVPSMYMLLIIYSIFNLNNISWGTREVTVEASPEQPQQSVAKNKGKHNALLDFFSSKSVGDNSGSFVCSIPGLFKCMLCTHKGDGDEKLQLMHITSHLDKLGDKLDRVLLKPGEEGQDKSVARGKTTILEGSKGVEVGRPLEDTDSSETDDPAVCFLDEEPNSWLEQEELRRGPYNVLPTKEEQFWKGLLEQYLFPIDETKNKNEKVQKLKDLRDKSVFAFFMLNALFVLVVFLLTLKKDLLHVNWPFDVKVNFTYQNNGEIIMNKEYLQLEPIGFVFLIFFAILLIVQFIGMLFHRFGTFSQILSTTYINWTWYKNNDAKNLSEEEILARDPVKVMKGWIKIKGADEEDEEQEDVEVAPGRRKTVKNLAMSGQKVQTVNDCFEAFERRITHFQKRGGNDVTGRKSMAVAIDKRRKTVHFRRQSQMHHNNNDSSKRDSTGVAAYHNQAFEERITQQNPVWNS